MTGTTRKTRHRRAAILKHLAAGRTPSDISRILEISRAAVSLHVGALGLSNLSKEERQTRAKARIVDEARAAAPSRRPTHDSAHLRERRKVKNLVQPFDPPPKGCRYYLPKQRRVCGKPKPHRSKNYCNACAKRVSPMEIV